MSTEVAQSKQGELLAMVACVRGKVAQARQRYKQGSLQVPPRATGYLKTNQIRVLGSLFNC